MENEPLPQIITTTELEVEVSSPHPFVIFHSIINQKYKKLDQISAS